MDRIREDQLLYIFYDNRRQWVRAVTKNKQFHCDRGFLEYNDIIGKEFGTTWVIPPNNHKIALIKPIISDIIFSNRTIRI